MINKIDLTNENNFKIFKAGFITGSTSTRNVMLHIHSTNTDAEIIDIVTDTDFKTYITGIIFGATYIRDFIMDTDEVRDFYNGLTVNDEIINELADIVTVLMVKKEA